MAIQRNGKLIKCPNCKSERIIVIKVLSDNHGTSCVDCGEKFLTGNPIIKGQKDLWNYPGDTSEWLSRGPKG